MSKRQHNEREPGMRGQDVRQDGLFSYLSLESRIAKKHPMRGIRTLADQALAQMNGTFTVMYSHTGRPSIPPERLIRASLLQALYSIRSERNLMEQLEYNLLYRWFVGLSADEEIWDTTVFSKNRDRLLEGGAAGRLLSSVIDSARSAGLVSEEHFSVDGTLLQAWASQKSFRSKDDPEPPPPSGGRNAEVDFKGQTRVNDTHASVTDPDAQSYRKGNGQESKLCYMGHALMENRNGLVVDACVTQATGTAEREAALDMIEQIKTEQRITLGADKGYDVAAFAKDLEEANVDAHLARNTSKGRTSCVPESVASTSGYAASQRIRKRIEEVFGWAKTVGGIRQVKVRGTARVQANFQLVLAAYNLVRINNLMPAPS
jgi:transposase